MPCTVADPKERDLDRAGFLHCALAIVATPRSLFWLFSRLSASDGGTIT